LNKKKKLPHSWLHLSLYKNCFGEGDKTHLGLKFRGNYYCITHNEANGVMIQKKYLKMREVSNKPEYFKRMLCNPVLLHQTSMYINKDFIISAILKEVLSK